MASHLLDGDGSVPALMPEEAAKNYLIATWSAK
jgi:hypothetical protein